MPPDYSLAWTAMPAIDTEAATPRAGQPSANDSRVPSRRAAAAARGIQPAASQSEDYEQMRVGACVEGVLGLLPTPSY
jgi:hypothetical protein